MRNSAVDALRCKDRLGPISFHVQTRQDGTYPTCIFLQERRFQFNRFKHSHPIHPLHLLFKLPLCSDVFPFREAIQQAGDSQTSRIARRIIKTKDFALSRWKFLGCRSGVEDTESGVDEVRWKLGQRIGQLEGLAEAEGSEVRVIELESRLQESTFSGTKNISLLILACGLPNLLISQLMGRLVNVGIILNMLDLPALRQLLPLLDDLIQNFPSQQWHCCSAHVRCACGHGVSRFRKTSETAESLALVHSRWEPQSQSCTSFFRASRGRYCGKNDKSLTERVQYDIPSLTTEITGS